MENMVIENGLVKTHDGKYNIGGLSQNRFGWRFIPHNAAHKSSRKSHATAEAAIPAWAKKFAKNYKETGSIY